MAYTLGSKSSQDIWIVWPQFLYSPLDDTLKDISNKSQVNVLTLTKVINVFMRWGILGPSVGVTETYTLRVKLS